MERKNLNLVKNGIKKECIKNKLNFIIVGSVSYKGIDSKSDEINCDDFDCIIIYDDILKLKGFPYISKKLYNHSKQQLKDKNIDLFATKYKDKNINISMDFISLEYFSNLVNLKIDKSSIFLKKMTDAEENPINDYYDFWGNKFIYKKKKEINDIFNIYHLPNIIFVDNIFFSGVFRNKFIHMPSFVEIFNLEIFDLKDILIKNQLDYYKKIKEQNMEINIENSIRNFKYFSKENKKKIKKMFDFRGIKNGGQISKDISD